MTDHEDQTFDELPTPELNVLASLDLEAREFTLDETRIFETVKEKHNVDELSKRLTAEQTQAKHEASSAQLEIAKKMVAKLEQRIDKLLDKPKWDDDEIMRLTEQLQAAKDRAHELILADVNRAVDANLAEQKRYEELMEVQERIHLETVYEVAKHRGLEVPKFDDWLSEANSADYDLAAEIVEAGRAGTPLARIGNRAQRRSKRLRA